MVSSGLKLNILSPEKTIFEGDVTRVTLPGEKAPFVVLHNHAPIISALCSGVIKWAGADEGSLPITGGFVEVKNNEVTVCVEV